jgi:hypothetical protein
MGKKSFRVPRADRPPEPFELVFEVRQQGKHNTGTEEEPVWVERDIDPPVWVEEIRSFHARMSVPGGVVLNTAPSNIPGDVAGAARQAKAIRDLLRICVVELDEFEALLDSDRTVIDMEQLSEICNWIVEESGQRPTNGPKPS